MNNSTGLAQLQTHEVQNHEVPDITQVTDSARYTKKADYEYTADSIWSNIRYFLGMLAVLIIPPFIPGVTTRGIIFSYAGVIIGIYLLAFVIKLITVMQQDKLHNTRRR